MSMCIRPSMVLGRPPDYTGVFKISQGAEIVPPLARRMALYTKHTLALLASTRSGTDGSYAFSYLSDHPAGYFVAVFDTGADPMNMGASDKLTLTPMVMDF
jgi:hypothetical protein